MYKLGLDPTYRRLSVEEFLRIDFEAKVELEDGLVQFKCLAMARTAEVAGNILVALGTNDRVPGRRIFSSDFAVQTGPDTIRFPDVSVYCDVASGPESDSRKLLGDPKLIVEVLSPSTAKHDQTVKAEEYRALAGLNAIMFVDPDSERVRLLRRTGPGGWADDWLPEGSAVELPTLGVTLPHAEIFARD